MVTAIIVTYNPEEDLLRRQNTSLASQVDNIIYVDNGSENVDIVKELAEEASLIENNKNLGLAKAQNQGIELAKLQKADFVLLFDQDSVPPVGFVDGLLHCYTEQSNTNKVALVGPTIRNLVNNSHENDKGVVFKGLAIKKVEVSDATEVSYCIASGSLMPMAAIDEVGGLCEEMFIDGLDVEWCLRAKSKGYKIYQTNNTHLDHCLGDGTTRRIMSHSSQREYYIMRNSIWMSRQNYVPLGYRLRKALLSIGRLFQSIACFEFEYAKADFNGLTDGVKL